MERIFSNILNWKLAIVESLMDDLDGLIKKSEHPTLLLSGGSTPGPIYELLDEKCYFLDKISIGLVDERFVPNTSKFSNERLLKSCFKKYVTTNQVAPMVYDQNDEEENIRRADQHLEIFKNNPGVVILGMGGDGHIASIFPEDAMSDEAVLVREAKIMATRAPSMPERRITCNLAMLLNAESVYLLIKGESKWNVLTDNSKGLPVHVLLAKRPDTKIYYLEENE